MADALTLSIAISFVAAMAGIAVGAWLERRAAARDLKWQRGARDD